MNRIVQKTTFELYEIFDDLGIKASDILQSNGIVWVEGPSDKIIIQDWLRKIGVSQMDLDQISIVFYGGSSIRRINFPELLKLNRNCVVIQDSDKTKPDEDLKDEKAWVEKECEALGIYCWTTKRREIENYFSTNSIARFIENHPRMKVSHHIIFGDYTDIETVIPNYRKDKPSNAREVMNYMTKNEIRDNAELFTELSRIKELIRSWNSVHTASNNPNPLPQDL